MPNTTRLFVFSCIAGIVSLVIFYIATTTKDFNQQRKSFDQLGGDFTLQSNSGNVSLHDFNDKIVVIYFGYLSCSEVCPNSLAVLTNAMYKVDKSIKNKVQGLFITVDPHRDTPDKLKEYTDYFHENIIGLTGTSDQIKTVSGQFGVYYDSSNLSDSFMEYSVSHASRFYVINQKGKLITAMSHTTTPNELAAKIKELL